MMARLFLLIMATLAMATSLPAFADLRIQRFVPELDVAERSTPAQEEKVEAIIFAPKGYTCRLQATDGFCTVPLIWLTSKEVPASLWRLEGDPIRMAYAYDGVVEAYLRLDQSITYELRDGKGYSDRLMDEATVSAILDHSPYKTGEFVVENDGQCQIYYGEESCPVQVSWTSELVETASVWQRTPKGHKLIIDRVPEGSLALTAYDFATVYELREGLTPGGQLLAATVTKGVRVVPEGGIDLPDGASCLVERSTDTCGMRVSWETNDIARLWLRERPMSETLSDGQVLVDVGIKEAVLDLRAGSGPSGPILARATVRAEQGPFSGKFIAPPACDIPYADDFCLMEVDFTTSADSATLWGPDERPVAQGQEGSFTARATEFGSTYHLRMGDDISSPLLATYIAKGNKQTYNGTLLADVTTCTLNYQRGSCVLSVDYTATDRATLWHPGQRLAMGGGNINGKINVTLFNTDGAATTPNRYDLRIHGLATPRITDPLLDQVVLTAIRPEHTASLVPATAATCNLLYSHSQCHVLAKIQSTAERVSVWEAETNKQVWEGGSGASIYLTANEGDNTYVIREGVHPSNDILDTLIITALRPDYHMHLSTPQGDSCTANEYNGHCVIPLRGAGNTTGRIYTRDITTQSPSGWTTYGNPGLSTAGNLTISNITGPRIYEVEARQSRAPYEVLDRIQVTANLGDQHDYTITSTLPGQGDSIPCITFENSDRCRASFLFTWDTTATRTTQCWRDNDENYYQSNVLTGKSINQTQYYSKLIDSKTMDIYEGSVSCLNKDQSLADGYRLLASVKMNKANDLPASQTPASFNSEEVSCNINYKGYGTCTVDIGYKLDEMGFAHGERPLLYVRSESGDFVTSGSRAVSRTIKLTLKEGIKDQVFELRASKGSAPSDDDPILSRVTGNHGYIKFDGVAMASLGGLTLSNYTSRRSESNPRYFDRSKLLITDKSPFFLGRNAENWDYAPYSQTCNLNIDQDFCVIYLAGGLSSTTGAASFFVNGLYIADFEKWGHSNTGIALEAGSHEVSLREGRGAGSKDNRLLDIFTIKVERPEYVGAINFKGPPENVPYHGAKVTLDLSFDSNTNAYLFDKSSGELLCTSTRHRDQSAVLHRSKCTVNYGEGEHVFELRTHVDEFDDRNVVLDKIEISLPHNEQGIYVNPHSTYPQYFHSCERTYSTEGCSIYYTYENYYPNSDGNSMSVCAYNSESDVFLKRNSLATREKATSASTIIRENEDQIWFVDGPECPESQSDTRIPILHKKEVSSTPPSIVFDHVVTARESRVLNKLDENTWECLKLWENDNCVFDIKSSIVPRNEPGQSIKAYVALYYDSNFWKASGTTISAARNFSGASEFTMSFVACEGNKTSSKYCPMNEESILDSFVIKQSLPVYVADLESSNDGYCQAKYGQSSCSLNISMTTDSGRVTIHRDGQYLETVSLKSFNKLFVLPAKPKGESTVIEVRDGTSKAGRVLASLEVIAELYDKSRFEFQYEAMSGKENTLSSTCIYSLHVISEQSSVCTYSIGYASDGSKKFVNINGGSPDFSLVKEISGNGLIDLSLITRPRSITQWKSSTVDQLTAHVYSDESLTWLMGSLIIMQKPTIMSEKGFSTFSGLSVRRSAAKISSETYRLPEGGFSARYHISGNNLLPVFSEIIVDDIALVRPPACSATKVKNRSSVDLCNYIDYLVASLPMPPLKQSTGSLSFSNSDMKVKRVFYRVANPTIANQLIDPTISLNGSTRPVNMDGQWHYFNVPDTHSLDVTITAMNIGDEEVALQTDWFAEYYTVD